MRITLFLFAALAVTQGSTTPPSNSEGSLPGHSDNSLLYSLLQAAGFTDSCVSGVLDMCSSAQEEAHFPSLTQNMQEVKVQLQKMQTEAQEGNQTLQQEIQELKAELQEVKARAQEGKDMIQQEVRGMMELITLMAYKLSIPPHHCKDLLDLGDSGRGLRQVYPFPERPHHNVTVYCDQETDGGGWTVFQRRDNSATRQNFYRNWTEYRTGFGDLEGEFWMGLDLLHEFAKTPQVLRVDLDDYDGEHAWAKYGTFRVGPEDNKYRLTVESYSGDAGDAMYYNDGRQFSTPDNDNDGYADNCAEKYRGGWWHYKCSYANLNGYQHEGYFTASSDREGIVWYQWWGFGYSLRRTAMMVRPAF